MRLTPLLLVLPVLAAGHPRPAAAQTPDTTPEAPAPRAPAPRAPYEPPRLAVSFTLGTLGFGEVQNQRVSAELLDAEGATTETQLLERRLAAEDGLQVGVSALLGLSPAWAVRAGATVGSANLAAGYSGPDAWEEGAEGLPDPASHDLSVMSVEGALRFRMRSGRRVQPYAELGLAAVRLEAEDPGYPGAGGLTGDLSMAAVAGFGAVVPVRGAVSGRIQATAQVFRNPAIAAEAGAPVAVGDTLRITFGEPAAGPFADPAREVLRILRLDLGISLELGAARRRTAAPGARRSASRP